MKYLLPTCLFFILISCGKTGKTQLENISLPSVSGNVFNVKEISNNHNSVFIFMSPDCPLCVSYTQTITEITNKFKHAELKVFLVFPGKYYSLEEITAFIHKYKLEQECLLDKNYLLTTQLKATVTPEAVLLNKEGLIVYTGAIDNRLYHNGRKRLVIDKNYLEHAVTQLMENITPDPAFTEPVGCFIEL